MRLLRWFSGWRLPCLACIGLFLWLVAQFYAPTTGFTSLVSIGSKLSSEKVTALRQVPHYVYEDSFGYDGVYYLQIALHPLLDEPELKQSIDNLQYRAKRILLPWTAWLLGGGQPYWIVQVYPLLNVFSWLVLAVLLWRWFPPDRLDHFIRWAGVLFAHGVCMSVRSSLVDLPSLLLVAGAVALVETGRRGTGTVLLAAATLGKETSVLAATAMLRVPPRGWRAWAGLAGRALLILAPLAAWMLYVRLRVGSAHETGVNNFTLPLMGFFDKWWAILAEFGAKGFTWPLFLTLLTTLALSVQFAYVLLRWQPASIWWRVGATFALLLAMVSEPVWEGYPGAASRVVLPLTLAFNVLVPGGRRWLPLLLAGNLTVAASFQEYTPPHDFYRVTGRREAAGALAVRMQDWYLPERSGEHEWRWSAGRSVLQLHNQGDVPLRVNLRSLARTPVARTIAVRVDGRVVWEGPVGTQLGPVDAGPFVLPPGKHAVEFASAEPATVLAPDPRPLAFAIYNLEIVVTTEKPAAQP